MAISHRARWWRLVNWKLVALVGVPAWAIVGGSIYHAHANRPSPPAPPPLHENDWHNIPFGPGHPLYCGEPPTREFVGPLPPPEFVGPPAPPDDPRSANFGPMLWFNITNVATLPNAQPGMPPHHPLLPDPDHLWAKVIDAQVRKTNELVKQAKLANLPVNVELDAPKKPVEKKKTGPPAEINGCKTFETYLAFQKSPVEAFKKAKADDKLVLMLHLAGNIEDDGFT